MKENNLYLYLVSTEKLSIEALPAGRTTIARAREIFSSYIDPDLKNWGLDSKQGASKEVAINVYELKKDATFPQMFNSLNVDLERLCLTQSQIIIFCKKYLERFRRYDYPVFLLFRENNEFFIASVHVSSTGLKVHVHRFSNRYIWGAEAVRRLVVPVID